MRAVVTLLLIAAIFGSSANAQTEVGERVGSALIMVQGSTVTINTGLPCNQRTYQMPIYEDDYKQMWSAIDNESYQVAFDTMRGCDSRLDHEPESLMGMINDFRLWLCKQPNMPDRPEYYFNGKAEDVVGDPNVHLSPAWCLAQYGIQFLNEEFGIGTPSSMTVGKAYPRWETSGDQGLVLTFSNGRITITAPEMLADPPWMPPTDYGDISTVEEIYYLPYKGAASTVRFAVRVVPDSVSPAGAVSLPLVSNSLGEGYAVPLLEGSMQLVIPFAIVEPVAATSRLIRPLSLRQMARQSGSGSATNGPVSLPQYLRPVISPGFTPTRVGQTFETWNPPEGYFYPCKGFPKLTKERVIALPHNTYVEIRSKGSKKITYNDTGAVVGVEAPIKGIPTKAQIDVEVGKTQQMFMDSDIGYYASGPIWYNERKYQNYRIRFHWVSVSNGHGGYSWRLDWYQKQIRDALEREYLKHEYNGGSNENPYPFIATLTGWRSKAWVWIPPKTFFGVQVKAGHWELRSCHWPINYGLTMMIYPGAGPGNPEGIEGEPIRVPPIPIYKEQ